MKFIVNLNHYFILKKREEKRKKKLKKKTRNSFQSFMYNFNKKILNYNYYYKIIKIL